jgi:RNA polymerase sigma-70 factor, ECF subfamily
MAVVDSRWLERCRKGDALAVECLVQTYQQDVYRMALSILDDPDDADDATQEVFVSALRGLASFQENASLKTWLFSITINVCRSRLQRFKRREKLMQILQGLFHLRGEQAYPEDEVMKSESNFALWKAIHSLDGKHRIPIVLRYYHDLPVADIAKMLGIPPGTVHSRLNHARERLRALLKEEQR